MKVQVYAPAYERSYKNNLGPGPAAYSKMYDQKETDNFRKTAFPKQRRKLTQSKVGPGPAQYENTFNKDAQLLKVQPRTRIGSASRKIDVIKCKYKVKSC